MKVFCGRYLLQLLTALHKERQWDPEGKECYFWFCTLNVSLSSFPPNLCALSYHVSKRQWISAFKTLPQKVVGFLDKEAGRKNLFHFKSLKIKILSNYVASFSCCCYLSCSRGLFWLHLARDARKLSPALVCEGPRECQKEDDHDGCPPSPGASRLPPGTEFQMVTTGDLLFI